MEIKRKSGDTHQYRKITEEFTAHLEGYKVLAEGKIILSGSTQKHTVYIMVPATSATKPLPAPRIHREEGHFSVFGYVDRNIIRPGRQREALRALKKHMDSVDESNPLNLFKASEPTCPSTTRTRNHEFPFFLRPLVETKFGANVNDTLLLLRDLLGLQEPIPCGVKLCAGTSSLENRGCYWQLSSCGLDTSTTALYELFKQLGDEVDKQHFEASIHPEMAACFRSGEILRRTGLERKKALFHSCWFSSGLFTQGENCSAVKAIEHLLRSARERSGGEDDDRNLFLAKTQVQWVCHTETCQNFGG